MKTRRLTVTAMLIALYVVLANLTINTGAFKFTLEAFPILLGALLYGPVDGLIVGGVGSFVYQLLFSGYGITPTTILWILPHALSGLIVGLYAKAHKFSLNKYQIIMISSISALLVTLLNTLALYVDAKLFGYYSKALVFGSLIYKIIIGIVLAIVYSLVIPTLVKKFKKNA